MDKLPKRLGDALSNNITTKDLDKMLQEVPSTSSHQKTNNSSSHSVSYYIDELDEQVNELKMLSVVEKDIAMDIINGVTFKAIAMKLDLDVATVKTIRNRTHVRKFISSYLNEASIKEKAYREELLAQIVEARLNNLSEDDDLSNLSNKDTLDIIVALDNIQKEKEKAELGTKDNPVVNILNLIKKD